MRTLFFLLAAVWTANTDAAGRPLAPPPIAPTSYLATGLATAHAGDRFLTVWNEWRPPFGVIPRGALADADGRRISEQSFVIEVQAGHQAVQLAGMGDRFALFHMDRQSVGMSELAPDGRLIVTRTTDLPPQQGKWSIGWNGSHFLVAITPTGYDYMRVYVLDRDARSLREPLTLEGGFGGIEVIANGNEFLVIASGARGLFEHIVRLDGTHGTDTIERMTRTRGLVVAPVSGATYMAAWSVEQRTDGFLLRTQLVTPARNTVSNTIVEDAGRIVPVGIMRTGDGYVLTYLTLGATSSTLYSVRLNANGTTSAPPAVAAQLPPTPDFESATNGRVLFTGLLPFYSNVNPAASLVFDANGRLQRQETLALSPRRQSTPALLGRNFEFLAAWSEHAAASALVRTANVALDGEPLSNMELTQGQLASRELASSGSTTLVLHVDAGSLFGTRVTIGGVNLDEGDPIRIGPMARNVPAAAVTWAGDRWVVVWLADSFARRVRFAAVSSNGDVSSSRELPFPEMYPMPRSVENVALAYGGQNLVLAWTEREELLCPGLECPAGDVHAYAARLGFDGTLGARVEVAAPQSAGISIATSGFDFFVAAGEWGSILEVRNGALRIVASPRLFNWSADSDVTWGGVDYVVALRYSGLNTYLATRRFDRMGRDSADARGTQTLPAQDPTPSIAAAVPDDSLVGLQEGDVANGMRAVVYRERNLALLPPPPQSPRNIRIEPALFSRIRVSWDPPPGPEPELYIVEVFRDGRWSVAATVPGNQRSAVIENFPFRVRAFGPGGASPETDPVDAGSTKRRAVRR